jgi:hypothetical protein
VVLVIGFIFIFGVLLLGFWMDGCRIRNASALVIFCLRCELVIFILTYLY